MHKIITALACGLFLTLAPLSASAECVNIEEAKTLVAKWDTNAQWDFFISGPKADRIVAWFALQYGEAAIPVPVNEVVVVHATGTDGTKLVIIGVSGDGKCVAISAKLTLEQYNSIVGE